MALPFGPYQGQDLTSYEEGNKFLPREFYSLNTTPSTALANTVGNTGGVTSTQAAGSYMGYPSYEAWLLAQGGGGDGGAGDVSGTPQRPWSPNQNLGPTNITDYEAEAAGVGSTWRGSLAKLQDTFSKLPTPGNILKWGIDKYQSSKAEKEEEEAKLAAITRTRSIRKMKEKYKDPNYIPITTGGGADIITTTGGATGEGGQGTGSPDGGAQAAGDLAGGSALDSPFAQGGRIGYEPGGVVEPGKQYYGKEDWEIQQINQYGVSYPEFLQNQFGKGLHEMDASEIALAVKAWDSWRSSQAQGGLIGYFDGGIAGLL